MKLGHITLDEKTRSQTNSLILGSIGFGKSKFLEYEMRQDLAARQPFCLIDFHGPLFEKVKAWCAFNAYYDRRIVLIDPANGATAKGFNPFRKKPDLDVGVQTSGMVEAMLRVWGLSSADSYPVIYKLTKVLFTVMIEKDLPFHEAFQLFTNRTAFAEAVNDLPDPLMKALWADLANLSQSEWSRQITPTVNKLFRIVQSKAMQRLMCVQKEDYNLELTFRDTILINLATSGSLDADAAKVFAALFLNALYHSAKRRKGQQGKDPAPYYVYIDEWWLVPTPDIARILAETRKFGLLLSLANQDLSQIKTNFGAEFAQTILTLCQVQCCFGGLNHSDATRLSKEWGVEPEAVLSLAQRQCLVKLPRHPASMITVPEVSDPFVRLEHLAEFEKRIAQKSGALPLEDIDRLLETTSKSENREYDTVEGYGVL
jgi:hypothetical protein